MKFSISAFLVGAVGVFFACTNPRSGPPALERQQYLFVGSTRCDTSTNQGVNVSVTYVLLKDDTDGARKINDSLRLLAVNSITSWLDSATVAGNPGTRTDLARAANLFVADYESIRKDMGSLGGCWDLKTTADTVHVSPKMMTVKYETYAYTAVLTRMPICLFILSIWKRGGC